MNVAFARLTYAGTVTGAAILCFLLSGAGIPTGQVLGLCVLCAVATVVILERLLPHDRRWNRSHGDVLIDLGHMLVVTFGAVLVLPLVIGFIASYSLDIWPSELPLVLQVTLALILSESLAYWVHRFQHTVPLLWRFHAVHHSAPRLYWFNTYRFHVVDILLITIPRFGVLAVFGISEPALLYYLVIAYTISFLEHSNVRSDAGWLNWVFTTPELHRWHHADEKVQSDKNFGQTVIIWDVLFGTRYLPEAGPERLGIEGPADFPSTFWAQLIFPFRRSAS